MGKIILALVLIFLVYAYVADFTDSDDIPYSIQGMHVFVVDESINETHKSNEIYTSYFDADTALKSCEVDAMAFADLKGFDDWSYYCCTVTPGNECVTKVK